MEPPSNLGLHNAFFLIGYCSENETYNEEPHCETTCTDYLNSQTNCSDEITAGCTCSDGYFRDGFLNCVKSETCDNCVYNGQVSVITPHLILCILLHSDIGLTMLTELVMRMSLKYS